VKSTSLIQITSGLEQWMLQVPREIARAGAGLSNGAVHDLRVVLRRCRSVADTFRAVDPDKSWKKMRRQATGLFDSLGALRDCQVMAEWVEKLGASGDAVTHTLMAQLKQREAELKERAREAIDRFDGKQWEQWIRLLPRRASRLPANSVVFQALALEKLATARRLQALALRTSNDLALHELRIALKKFRYVTENFLPLLHQDWKDGLKLAQDLLGEIHDLDVLQSTINQVCADAPAEALQRWEQTLKRESADRMERYRALMTGPGSLWMQWRAALPRGKAARNSSLTRLQVWSQFLGSDVQHTRRVTRFAVQLYDGLERIGLLKGAAKDDRDLLRAAATVHEVGRVAGNRNHHKRTEKMVIQLRHLVGWASRDISAMARIARYHRGALPRITKLQDLPAAQRKKIKLLAGILRLANALDAKHDGSVQRVRVVGSNGFVAIRAQGLVTDSSLAETIAAARHLLEITCGLPFLVQPSPKRKAR